MRPAPIWRRTLAWAVDAIAILGVVAGYLWVALAVTGLKLHPSPLSGIDAVMERAHTLRSLLVPGLILGVVLALAYSAVFAILWNGRTPGRRVLRINLVDRRGLSPAPARTIIRACLSTLSFGFFLGGIWLALFDRKGQTLHDKLTATYVVRTL